MPLSVTECKSFFADRTEFRIQIRSSFRLRIKAACPVDTERLYGTINVVPGNPARRGSPQEPSSNQCHARLCAAAAQHLQF
jgi:hypothetical protein